MLVLDNENGQHLFWLSKRATKDFRYCGHPCSTVGLLQEVNELHLYSLMFIDISSGSDLDMSPGQVPILPAPKYGPALVF